MKTLAEIKQMVSQHKSFLIQHYGIKNIGIFGSYVRNDSVHDKKTYAASRNHPLPHLRGEFALGAP